MSEEDIRKLNARVAREVMGLHVQFSNAFGGDWTGTSIETGYSRVKPYSTDRAAALEVVDRLLERDLRVEMSGNKQGWLVTIDNGNCENEVSAQAATLQEAICIAALKCVAAKPETKTA